MKKYRVHFNRTFGSHESMIGELTGLVFNDCDSSLCCFEVSESTNNVNSPLITTEGLIGFYPEKSESMDFSKYRDAYKEWMINYIMPKHDILWATKYLDRVSEIADELRASGKIVVCEGKNTLKRIEKKSDIYENLSFAYPGLVPWYRVIKGDSGSTLESQRNKLKLEMSNLLYHCHKDVCLKLNSDEGGGSFHRIVTKSPSIDSLNGYHGNQIYLDDACKIADESEDDTVLFMECLDGGSEISVDCYHGHRGFICLAREKEGGCENIILPCDKRYREISECCLNIGAMFGLEYCYNVQFRFDCAGKMKIIDLNPRLSGGVYKAMAYGINFPYIVLCDILTKDWDTLDNFYEWYYSITRGCPMSKQVSSLLGQLDTDGKDFDFSDIKTKLITLHRTALI